MQKKLEEQQLEEEREEGCGGGGEEADWRRIRGSIKLLSNGQWKGARSQSRSITAAIAKPSPWELEHPRWRSRQVVSIFPNKPILSSLSATVLNCSDRGRGGCLVHGADSASLSWLADRVSPYPPERTYSCSQSSGCWEFWVPAFQRKP